MKKKEVYFDSRDGATKLHGIKWVPEGQPKAIIQIVHGMAEYIERYDEFATYLVEQGYLVMGEDHLGHGKSVGENGTRGYFCQQDPATVVVRDVHRLKKMVQEEYPSIPIFILGHSMGSFILRNYLSQYGTGIDGAIIVGTGGQPPFMLKVAKGLASFIGKLKGEKTVGKLLHGMAFGSYNKRIMNAKTHMDWLSVDENNVKDYIADKDCGFFFTNNGFLTLFELIERAQDEERMKKIPKSLPILVIAGEEDPVGDYGKWVRALYHTYQSMGMEQVTLKLYEGLRHEILNEGMRQDIYTYIEEWVKKYTAEQ